MATTIYAILFYAATLLLVFGLGYRVWQYATTPAPLKIPTTPAPLTQGGAALRVLREVTIFQSLFKANKWIWLFGWIFHVALAVVLLRHLRYFLEPVPAVVMLIQPIGVLAGFALVAALVALWGRRLLVARIRYISGPSDHLMLLLIIAIGVSGLAMKFVSRTDIVAVKAFFLGLVYLDWRPLPDDPILLVHLALVAALMMIFPFSKLLHAPGVFFSPTRNQADDSRERRHVPPARLGAAARGN
ncbi:MAG: respiratory nitrate reductase subunit gamma [Xanthobacteraceae bacterium]